MAKTSVSLSLTEDYCASWGCWEGVRELVQNCHDGALEHGQASWDQWGVAADAAPWRPAGSQRFEADVAADAAPWRPAGSQRFEATSAGRSVATVLYDASKQRLTLVNRGVGLQRRVLLLGTSQKVSAEAIGQFGEGMKVGTLALIREGRQVEMATRDEHWQWTRRLDPNFGVRVLTVDVSSRTNYEAAAREAAAAASAENAADGALELALGADDTSCTVEPLSAREWAAFSRRFLFLVPPADSFRCELGELLLDDRLNGDLFVKNVFISSLKKELDLGSGLNLRNLRLDRDRRAVLHASDLESQAAAMWVRAIDARPELAARLYELLQAPSPGADVRRVGEFLSSERPTALEALGEQFFAQNGEAVPVASGTALDHMALQRRLGVNVVVVSSALLAVLMKAPKVPSIEALEAALADGPRAPPIAWESLSDDERGVARAATTLATLAGDGQMEVGLLDVFDGDVPPPAAAAEHRPVPRRVEVPRSALAASEDKHLAAVLLFRQIANARLLFLRGGAPPSPAAVAELSEPVEALGSLKLGKSGGQDQMVNRALAVLSAHLAGAMPGRLARASERQGTLDGAARRELLLREELRVQEEAAEAAEERRAADNVKLRRELKDVVARLDQHECEAVDREAVAREMAAESRRRAEEAVAARTAAMQKEVEALRARAAEAEERVVAERAAAAAAQQKASAQRDAHARWESTVQEQLAACRERLVERTEQVLRLSEEQHDGGEDDGGLAVAAEAVARGLREELEARRCVVCMRAERSVVLLPCRHAVLCGACSGHIEKSSNRCPLCRVAIDSTMRVYA